MPIIAILVLPAFRRTAALGRTLLRRLLAHFALRLGTLLLHRLRRALLLHCRFRDAVAEAAAARFVALRLRLRLRHALLRRLLDGTIAETLLRVVARLFLLPARRRAIAEAGAFDVALRLWLRLHRARLHNGLGAASAETALHVFVA